MAAFVTAYDAQGITKHIRFDATGEPGASAVFYTRGRGRQARSKGLIPS